MHEHHGYDVKFQHNITVKLPLNFSISTMVLASSGRKELADLIVESVASAGSTGSDFACDNQISQIALLIKFTFVWKDGE